MNKNLATIMKFLAVFVLVMTLVTLAASPAPQATADEIGVTLDGLRDSGYVLIATDPAGDLASPGPAD